MEQHRFVRLPTDLLETLSLARFTGVEWRVVIWVIRQTHGWNRQTTPFTWYRIAQDLRSDRAAIYRAGHRLVQAHVLVYANDRLGIHTDSTAWDRSLLGPTVAAKQRWISPTGALPGNNQSVVCKQRFSVGLKTLKAKYKRRRGGGQCGYPVAKASANTSPVEQLMNHYVVLRGTALTEEQTAIFYRTFERSARVLLQAYAQNLTEAKAALTKVAGVPHDG